MYNYFFLSEVHDFIVRHTSYANNVRSRHSFHLAINPTLYIYTNKYKISFHSLKGYNTNDTINPMYNSHWHHEIKSWNVSPRLEGERVVIGCRYFNNSSQETNHHTIQNQ